MRRYWVLTAVGLLQACSGDDNAGGGGAPDASRADTSVTDTGAPGDAGGGQDVAPADTGGGVDAAPDGGGCPAGWALAPTVDPSIAVPDGGGGVLLHALGTGTQDYTCAAVTTDAGTSYAWTFTGPEADLMNCASQKIGKHFASDGGATLPEWLTTADGTYVIAKRVAAFTPDGGAPAVPWLLLQEQSTGGAGLLSKTAYVQRVNTTGGVAPAAADCTQDKAGTSQTVPYSADYFFFGAP